MLRLEAGGIAPSALLVRLTLDKNEIMDIFDLETTFTSGKYTGKTLREVIYIDCQYIDWCLVNIDNFYISKKSADEIFDNIPEFILSNIGAELLDAKLSCLEDGRKFFYYEWTKRKSKEYNDSFEEDEYFYGGGNWNCDICDGNWETGCLFNNPADCPHGRG